MNTTVPDYEALVAERTRLKAAADDAMQRVKQIDDQLRDLGYGTHQYAGVKVTISPHRRLNAGRFRDAFPVDKHPELWKVSVDPDTTAIRNAIAPDELDAYYDEGTPVVRVS